MPPKKWRILIVFGRFLGRHYCHGNGRPARPQLHFDLMFQWRGRQPEIIGPQSLGLGP